MRKKEEIREKREYKKEERGIEKAYLPGRGQSRGLAFARPPTKTKSRNGRSMKYSPKRMRCGNEKDA
ncbi:hypothetical protein SUGI_0558340 [Cryptomeria japonica]|nr:hypothetical protein SUGI_0558340 [Cryptomeria japonica]